MELLDRIKACKTMRELDELRIDIIRESKTEDEFKTFQQAFIKKNSLKRNGHTRRKEGYELRDVIGGQEE